MEGKTLNSGISITSISFGAKGEMIVLDPELLELVSGGLVDGSGDGGDGGGGEGQPVTGINVCPKVNMPCTLDPAPPPSTPPPPPPPPPPPSGGGGGLGGGGIDGGNDPIDGDDPWLIPG